MAQETKTAVNKLLGEIQRCNHSQGQGTSPVVCWDCAIAAMESYTSLQVAEQKKKDANLVSEMAHHMEQSTDIKSNATRHKIYALDKAALAIEKGANDG